ncbi:unnamed protein product [Dovyalis caffra]|uniref:TIR domain-containing protein n=1 Tax=Dovyalis caffra TaxID=77055 RepID=A0AAV1QQY8_9ROSI|nr:unnamed protein product [Dovyalis caffra]
MASSSTTSTTKLGRKHQVFLSFSGEDTRVGFTSHLHAALERKNILTFIDDDLRRGEEISDSLVKAIGESMLSVIIFSQHYASSKWCLDELQSGCFGDAFAELVKKKALVMEEERCYRAALKEAGNLSGHDSRKIGIVSEESENPRKRSRLVDPEDIYHVLKKRKVKAIVNNFVYGNPIKSDAFAGMRCLEFLIIKGNTSKVQLPHCGLEYLPNLLRYFRRDRYPSRSWPQNFCAENLVELDFSGSQVEKLWSGQQNLVNLRRINLSYSRCLTKLPDLSKANQLHYVDLDDCISLIEVPSYFQYFENLEGLFLALCYNLQCFPRRIDSNKIKRLSLRDCPNIKKSPQISTAMERLFLSGTAIEELQQSFGGRGESFLYRVAQISLNFQRFQEMLNTYIWIGLLSTSFPEIMEPMESLMGLALSKTTIKELPSSIRHLKSLYFLNLDGTLIKELPELPPSLTYLSANNCVSLEFISSSTLGDSKLELDFSNRFKLDQKALMEDMQLKIQFGKARNSFRMVFPGSEIPQWFSDQSTGSSITIQFPLNPPKLKAIAFCLVFASSWEAYRLRLCWQPKINDDEHDDVICSPRPYFSDLYLSSDWFFFRKLSGLDHMHLWYDNKRPVDFGKYFGHEVTFDFNIEVDGCFIASHLRMKCGVHLVFDENPDPLSSSYEDD